MGCGEAELAERLGSKYKVHSFDLVSLNERVVVADMAKIPLARESVDVCVYCLSLMGTNLAHFFREAHRVLKMKWVIFMYFSNKSENFQWKSENCWSY